MPGLPSFDSSTFPVSRRSLICSGLGAVAAVAFGGTASAARTSGFARWVAAMRPRAIARGVSPATYARVTDRLTPDLSVLESLHAQPEFTQKLWQYINRCCSEWRVTTGK